MNANQTLKNNCRNSGSPFNARRSKTNSPGNRKKERNRTLPKKNSPKHRQNIKRNGKSVEDLIILPRDDLNNRYENIQYHGLKHKSVDESVLNTINGVLSSSNDSVATLKNEDFHSSSDFSVTSSPLHKPAAITEDLTDNNHIKIPKSSVTNNCGNTIVLSPNGDHISIVTSSQSVDEPDVVPDCVPSRPLLNRCHSVYVHCDNDLASTTETKKHNRRSYDGAIRSLHENEADIPSEVDRLQLQNSYAQKLHDSLDLMLKDADPIDLIYDRDAHTPPRLQSAPPRLKPRQTSAADTRQHPSSLITRQTSAADNRQHPSKVIQSIDESRKFTDLRGDKINPSSRVTSQSSAKESKRHHRHTWCYESSDEELTQERRMSAEYHATGISGGRDSNGGRHRRHVTAAERTLTTCLHNPDTPHISDPDGRDNTDSRDNLSTGMGETHRVMRRYRTKSAQHSTRPRSELIESTKQYDRRATDSCRARCTSTARPVSMYELNGRVNILHTAAVQHQRLQDELKVVTDHNEVPVVRRDNSQNRPRSKYATMRPLSLSSVEDTMSVLAGYSSDISYSHSNKTTRSQHSPTNMLRNTNMCKPEMRLTSWPECASEFIDRRHHQRQSLPQDFDSRWRSGNVNKCVNMNDLDQQRNMNRSRTSSAVTCESYLNDNITLTTPSRHPQGQGQCRQCNYTTTVNRTPIGCTNASNAEYSVRQQNTNNTNSTHYRTTPTVNNTSCRYVPENSNHHGPSGRHLSRTISMPEPNLIDLSDPLDMCNDAMSGQEQKVRRGATQRIAQRTSAAAEPLSRRAERSSCGPVTDAEKYTNDKRK